MLSDFHHMWDGHLGQNNAVKHVIDLISLEIQTIYSASYCSGARAPEFQQEEIDEILKMHVIPPVQTELSEQIEFACKKNETLCTWVHYQNTQWRHRQGCLPSSRIGLMYWFTWRCTSIVCVECEFRILEIQVDGESRNETAFPLHNRLFHFLLRPFGLQNAPGTFQRVMDVILEKLKFQPAFVYPCDISMFLKSPSRQVKRVHQVLQLLSGAEITLKLWNALFAGNVE